MGKCSANVLNDYKPIKAEDILIKTRSLFEECVKFPFFWLIFTV